MNEYEELKKRKDMLVSREERAIKIKLLEQIKEELHRYHSTLREGYDALKGQGIFYRDADEMFLREMASIHLAELQLNKILYPLYYEIQREEKLSPSVKDLKRI